MKLSEEDIKILTLEKKKRENDARYSPLPNCEERDRLWKKSWNLMLQINALIYDTAGNYRKDKRHLLTGGSLDLSLLDTKEAAR
ncbi:hypothetical protein [Caproiciproducens sp.]|uniref:hypothetical protein n=1 Tax=Caproiciproducens sp. TaxID=1954376 RepID=UPI002897708A|nr:hypothetical protein [Caproiciproducens sp.]